jgi:hypothetical protein
VSFSAEMLRIGKEIPNDKHQIANKSQIPIFNDQNKGMPE